MKRTIFYTLYWITCILLLILTFFWIGCTGSKKTAEQKAYEAAEAERHAAQRYRELYPCDTSSRVIIKRDTTETINNDTIYLQRNDTVFQTIYKNRTIKETEVKENTVVDSSLIRDRDLQIQQKMYLISQANKSNESLVKENKELLQQVSKNNNYKGIVIGMGIGLVILIGFTIYSYIKRRTP